MTDPSHQTSEVPESQEHHAEPARGKGRRRKYWLWAAGLLVLLLVFPPLLLALTIYLYSFRSSDRTSDAAIVLGAAVWSARPSPVFQERIDHAVSLYRKGKVRKLLFTGGRAEGDELSEAAAARRYAVEKGVPAEDILVENRSTRTFDNLAFAKPIAEGEGLRTFLVVSDPLHMRRAMSMAEHVGLDAVPSPTPTSRYRSFSAQTDFLLREMKFYAGYLLQRAFRSATADKGAPSPPGEPRSPGSS